MDAIKSFNNELTQLYDVKPPISKAKMTAITRTAIKAIKFYKHVVQSVEKFIMKCKPEYKVPGLYVIDSIVRQSRHQFGPDKDVFAPRFAKNMQLTFANLFSCPPEEKGKIIRVLNLWQKNQVFTPDVIQPLFDQLADPSNPIHRDPATPSNGVATSEKSSPTPIPYKPAPVQPGPPSASKLANPTDQANSSWVKVAQTQIEAANKAIMELSGVAGLLGQQQKAGAPPGVDIIQQLQHLQQLILSQTPQKQDKGDQVMFDKKLLDFDYDDEDDENTSPHQPQNNDSLNNILQNPDILRSLTAIQQHMSQAQLRQQQIEEEKMKKLREMKQQEEEFDKHLAQTVPKLPFASECDFKQMGDSRMQDVDPDVECIEMDGRQGRAVEVINIVDRSPSPSAASRRGSRSRSRSRRRRSGSRSRSRSRSARRRRHRSRSRSRQRYRDRDREKERERDRTRDRGRERDRPVESAKDKERKKKGLPPIKKGHLSVCSTTLWIGHLSKLVQQEDLSNTFGEYGEIISIDLIPPRGCAFVCMNRRQDASRALNRLNERKIQGKVITLAWAPGKGVKGRELKDFWEVELGVSYIPWTRLRPTTNFADLEEGGHLDEETMPGDLKTLILEQIKKNKDNKENPTTTEGGGEDNVVVQPPPGFIALPGMPGGEMVVPPMPVMNIPPPGMPPLPTGAAPAGPGIDTSQPPPGLPHGLPPNMPVMAKGLILPPFPFSNLPPPLGMGLPNILGNLQLGPPPGVMLPQGLMPPLLPAPPAATLENRLEENQKLVDDGEQMELDDDVEDPKNKFRDTSRDWPPRGDRRSENPKWEDKKDWGRDRDESRWQGRDSWNRPDRNRDRRNRSRSRERDRDTRRRSSERRKSVDRDEMGFGAWVSAPDNKDKPSLSERLRSLADGNAAPPVPDDGIILDSSIGDRLERPKFSDRQIRSLFEDPPQDSEGPLPPLGMPGAFDDMMMPFNDRGPRFEGPPALMRGPPLMNDFPPRMRFGPRNMPPGAGPMFGMPRGTRPRHMGPWMGPMMGGPRPLFDDRPRWDRDRDREWRNNDRDGRRNDRDWNNDRDRNSERENRSNDRESRSNDRDGKREERRRRDGPRTSRWSKDESAVAKEIREERAEDVAVSEVEGANSFEQTEPEPSAPPDIPPAEFTENIQEAMEERTRDVQTPVVDEPAMATYVPEEAGQGSSTPCHDEPSLEAAEA